MMLLLLVLALTLFMLFFKPQHGIMASTKQHQTYLTKKTKNNKHDKQYEYYKKKKKHETSETLRILPVRTYYFRANTLMYDMSTSKVPSGLILL